MLRIAVILLTIMLAYGAIYSLMALTLPKVVLRSTIQASIGKTIDNAQADGYLKALKVVMINLGGMALAGVIADFFILFTGFRKAQRWAWLALLIAGCIGWSVGLIINIVIGDMTNMTLHIIGVVLFLAGLLIPVKAFFGKAAEESPQEAQETQES